MHASVLPATTLAEARRLREGGDPAEALRLLLPAVDETPDDLEAWLVLGGAALDLGSLPEAERAYRRALALAPEHRDALIGVGLVSEAQGRHDDARTTWARTAELLSADPVPSSLLGANYMRVGEMKAAEDWFREALRRRPDHADAQAGLGSILERTGRAEEGVCLLEPALASHHPHGGVAAIMARCMLDLDRPDATPLDLRRCAGLTL
ncbi:MAG: tetratricopeptide repeat protein [Actinomycetales bacterium]|nr:tetratricopeptide repeat protein [Actinomycetales bacterium]